MGSIGAYKYPEHKIEEAVEIVEMISEEKITKQDLLAEKLGHKSKKSGAFRNKLTSLRRYGLINSRGDIEMTTLSKKIVSPAPQSNERERSIGKAVLNVELLKKLYERLDYSATNDEFWYQLVEETDVDRGEAKNKSSKIRGLYESGLSYVEGARNGTHKENPAGSENHSRNSESESEGASIRTDVDATLVTPDAEINIRSKATYLAAKELFREIGEQYKRSENDGVSEDITDF